MAKKPIEDEELEDDEIEDDGGYEYGDEEPDDDYDDAEESDDDIEDDYEPDDGETEDDDIEEEPPVKKRPSKKQVADDEDDAPVKKPSKKAGKKSTSEDDVPTRIKAKAVEEDSTERRGIRSGKTKQKEKTKMPVATKKAKHPAKAEKIVGKPALKKSVSAEKSAPNKIKLKVGKVLTREYKGKTIEVKTVEDGYVYKKKKFSSLSALAESITGNKINGPKFFGLGA